MLLIGVHQYRVIRLQRDALISRHHCAAARYDIHLVLPRVRVERRVAAGFDLKPPHAERRRARVLVEQPLNPHTRRPRPQR